MDFASVAELCAPGIAPDMAKRIASVESGFNPYAIGVVGARLQRQPRSLAEAIVTANALAANGWNYSAGLVQINQRHFAAYGLTVETAFDPCRNLRAGASIFQDCYRRAPSEIHAVDDALSCYYSGNFTTGYRLGYVSKVEAVAPQADAPAVVSPIAVGANLHLRTRVVSAPRGGPPAGEGAALFVSPLAADNVGAADTTDTPASPKGPSSALLF